MASRAKQRKITGRRNQFSDAKRAAGFSNESL